MDQLYPPGPDVVVEELVAPGPTYKRRAKVALLSLLLFIVLYLSLTSWFGWTAYKYFVEAMAAQEGALIGFGLAAAATLLTVFLVKALFFVNRGGEVSDLEITPDEQPQLFEFLYRLADDAGAPRPHRVFLSGRVNAAVFYDLTLLNLLFPSKKNLEIGLALVNGLNLGEFKAVLAHEFGHFRQGSMAVGRWVYVAQQIASHIVYQRDIIDRFLMGLSSIDIRIAWIGWILRIIVWALRAILDTAFSLVVLAQRSLSREMEFHADMVSVSLTGSDALIHALHRLGAADDAWSRALDVAGQELNAGRAVSDVFVIQKIITERMKEILDDENHDKPPPLPEVGRESHRIFAKEQAHPPQMWSTHPPNRDREENAKKQYIEAMIDERPAWEIFQNAQQLRLDMTEHLLRSANAPSELARVELIDTVSTVNQQYDKAVYDRRYRGSYMGRSVVREFEKSGDAIGIVDAEKPHVEQLDALYPEALSEQFEAWRNLEEEKETLRSLRDGLLVPPDGVIRHRGKILKKQQLPEAIESMRDECDVARQSLCEHDCQVRGVHNAIAAAAGNGWREYHTGLVKLLHYADHTAADLADVQGRLANLWAVVIADGKVSRGEIQQLLEVANDMYGVLNGVNNNAAEVILSPDIANGLGVDSWRGMINEEYSLPAPSNDNLGDWLSAADGWCGYFRGALTRLQMETLEVLLAAEERISGFARENADLGSAPAAAAVPQHYSVLLPNTERKLQRRLGLWDRFQTADGFFPGLARFTVATAIVGGLLGLGSYMSSTTDVVVYNGLATVVEVETSYDSVTVKPMSHKTMTVNTGRNLEITSYIDDGTKIETIEVNASNSFNDYVYNVAGAMPLLRWEAVYGSTAERPPVLLGAQTWIRSDADLLFEDPPNSINTSGSGGSRSVISEFEDFDPRYLSSYLPEGAATEEIVNAHARWDEQEAAHTVLWLSLASVNEDFAEILAERLNRNPRDILALRFEQDSAIDDATKATVCERHNRLAAEQPDDSTWRYLAIRCAESSPQQNRDFIQAYQDDLQNPWLAGAAAYSYAEFGQWEEAAVAFESAYSGNSGMRVALADETARARRMARGVSADVSDLASSSYWLQSNLLAASGESDVQPYLVPYQRLYSGDLEAAIEASMFDEDLYHQIVRFAAASDGASRAMIETARQLTESQGLTSETYWMALGFAERHGLPKDDLIAQAEVMLGFEGQTAIDFLAAVNDTARAEAVLQDSRSMVRGHAYVLGVVALGDKAPDAWREGAKRLLFTLERPYLR